MEGRVTNLEPRLVVSFRHSGNAEIEVVVDTGFSGHLALAPNAVELIGLEKADTIRAELADGSSIRVDVFTAWVFWQGYEVEVLVMATGDRPLLGTGLLAGWEFKAQFIEGGLVTVSAIE